MMEAKKDALRQVQDGLWKITFTVQAADMPVDLMQAPMGTIYNIDISDAEQEAHEAVYTDAIEPVNRNIRTTDPVSAKIAHTEKTEGEKLRQRACILCKEIKFQEFVKFRGYYRDTEEGARADILDWCCIESRSEITTDEEAQRLFRMLDNKYKEWKNPIEEQYPDNLSKI